MQIQIKLVFNNNDISKMTNITTYLVVVIVVVVVVVVVVVGAAWWWCEHYIECCWCFSVNSEGGQYKNS